MKELKKRVMHYAKLLNVSKYVYDIKIDKTLKELAEIKLSYNIDECIITFNDENPENITIIHELLHICFKNTFNIIGVNFEEDKKIYNIFEMIHEQEVDKLAKTLCNVLPRYMKGEN